MNEIQEKDFSQLSSFEQLVELGKPEGNPGKISLKSFFKELLAEGETVEH